MLPVDAKVQRPLTPFASRAQPADLTQSGRHGAISTPMPLIFPGCRNRLKTAPIGRVGRSGVAEALSSRALATWRPGAAPRVRDESTVTSSALLEYS